MSSPPRVEGTMHGRFEEVTYHSKAEHSGRGSDAPPVFSSDSSEPREGDWDTGGAGTPKSTISVADSGSPSHEMYESNNRVGGTLYSKSSRSDSVAFNNLVELRRRAGTAKISHEGWEGMTEDCSGQRFDQSELEQNSHGMHDEEEEDQAAADEEVSQELELLAMSQKQELEELQWRHEQALLAIKNRHRNNKAAGHVSDHEQLHTHRRSVSPELGHQISISLLESLQHHQIRNYNALEPQIAHPTPRNSHYHDVGSRKVLPFEIEDTQKLSRLSSIDSTAMHSNIRFVAAPKAYGLGHNLQGHILIEPDQERRPPPGARTSEESVETKGKNHIPRPEVSNDLRDHGVEGQPRPDLKKSTLQPEYHQSH